MLALRSIGICALALTALAGSASAQVLSVPASNRYFDSISNATTFSGVATGSAPITGVGNIQTGMIVNLANFTAGSTQLSGIDVPIANLTGTNITARPVRLNMWIWQTSTVSTTATAPVFSNLLDLGNGASAPSLVLNIPSFTLATGFFETRSFSVPAFTINPTAGSTVGFSFNWQVDNGAGFVSVLNLNTTVIGGATQLAPATGTNFLTAATGGYFRSANSTIDVNGQFANGSARNIGNNSGVPFAVYTVPTPGAAALLGLASAAVLRRRR